MSLAIEVDYVTGVLLRDGWHEVLENSFTIDAYEYVHSEAGSTLFERELLVKGGKVKGVSATGAAWTEPGGSCVACPFPAILAVKYRLASGQSGVAPDESTETTQSREFPRV
jgi:hypothetical protein